MTYTVNYSNTGHGKAYISRLSTAHRIARRTFPGSTTWNGTPMTDAADADAVTVINGGKCVTITIGTLNASATGTVAFKITVN